MDPAASAPLSDAESAVRPVEATADPSTLAGSEHVESTKAEEATDASGARGSVDGKVESAVTGDNQLQEPASECAAAQDRALSPERDAGSVHEATEASPPSSEKRVDASSAMDSPLGAATSSPAAREPPAVEQPAIPSDEAVVEAASSAAPTDEALAATCALEQVDASFVSEEILARVQQFLTDKVALGQCSSHSKEILEFAGQHLSDKQRRRYAGPLVQRVVDHFARDAQAKGEDVSVDVQTSLCLVEHLFLTLGRQSPLQDMYTQEEEEMLDLLFHGEGDAGSPD